ncbi:MAG: PAS domain-containing protein [Verrucomicrobia bacterium]|nr:PAS domain-containing protein [Verrucomicrobiota bacterium]
MEIPDHAALDLQALFEAVPDLYVVVQPSDDYPIVAVSAAFLQATMSRAEDLVGRNLFEVFRDHADTPEAGGVRAALERVRESRAPEKLDVLGCDLRRPGSTGDGREERYWRTLLSPVITADGTLRFIICRIEDVTSQVRSEREIGDVRSRLEAILAAAEIGTWIWNVERDRVIADRNLARLFGVSPEDAAGGPIENYLKAIHKEDWPRVKRAISDAVREGTSYETEYRIFQPGGSYRWVVARGWAEKDVAGRIKRFPGVVVDITERKLAEEALRESEERLRMAVESANLGTWDYDPVTGELIWSDQTRAMFGLPPDADVNYQVFLQGVHPGDRTRTDAAVQAALRLEDEGRYEIDYRTVGRQDGIERWVTARGRAFLDERGQVRRFIGTVLDITERKRAEEAAARRSAQLQELAAISTRLNAAHDVPSVLGIITEEARKLIGAHQAATTVVLDRHKAEPVTIVSPCDKDLPPESRVGAPVQEGPPSPDEAITVPLLGRNTQSFGVIRLSGKFADQLSEDDLALLAQLSQIAAGAIENARLYEELREKDQRKDEFLAMLAHELRNPLAAIRNAAALSEGVSDAREIGWSMEVIQRQLQQLTRLIDDLFDVSRITRGKIQLRKEQLDAASALRRAVEAVQPLIEERQHELTVSFRPGTLYLEADPTRLEQIVVNLLTNAAKYTEAGGHISLHAKNDGNEIVISVRDDGMGIPPEKLPQMFELFVQGDRSLARSEGGLGIGLTLVRSLAEMHGGSVRAYSEGLGKGSEFVVRLPASKKAAPARPVPTATTAIPGPTTPANRPARILVVDDNMDSAHTLAKLLSRQGHDVRTVYDGPAAIEAARAHRPEFVLLDIGLPGMDGYQVATRLRQENEHSILIALSGYGQESDRNRSREAGFHHHLVKPVEHSLLAEVLANPPVRVPAPASPNRTENRQGQGRQEA